jgi:hypothetical protein
LESPLIELESEFLRVVIDPDRGGQIVFVGSPDGQNVLMYEDWISPLPAAESQSYGSDVLDWLSGYRGGWQELFPNAGAPTTAGPLPLPIHGEASRSRWSVLEQSDHHAVLQTGARLPLALQRTMNLDPDGPALFLDETIRNLSPFDQSYLWGHHVAFSMPPGTAIDFPAGRVIADTTFDGELVDIVPGSEGGWPLVPGKSSPTVDLSVVPEGPVERMCYLPDLRGGWAALRDVEGGVGVGLSWAVEVFPHAWLWEEVGGAGFPWYGRARITAIEPQTSWPNDGLAPAIDRGQAHHVDGSGIAQSWLTIRLFTPTPKRVSFVSRTGEIKEETERW